MTAINFRLHFDTEQCLTDECDPNPPAMKPKKTRSDRKEAKIQRLSSSVLANFRLLHTIVTRHEATIQKRWLRKKKRQRAEILQRAYPSVSMPKRHHPEVPALNNAARKMLSIRKIKSREPSMREMLHVMNDKPVWDALMLPSLNEEDLVQPRNLLLLLNARARNHPCKFACSDAGNMNSDEYMIQDREQNPRLVLLLDEENYGRIVNGDAVPPPLNELQNAIHFHPVEAHEVLLAQDKMMKFLIACCKEILHDMSPEQLINDQLPAPEAPTLDIRPDKNRFTSLCHMVQESPYLVPSGTDLGRIESLLGACVASHEDHVWALREDPGYFRTWWVEELDHSPDDFKGLHKGFLKLGASASQIKAILECLSNATPLARMMLIAYIQIENFAPLHDMAREVCLLHKKYAPDISTLKDLPNPLLEALIKLHMSLQSMAYSKIRRIWDAMPASPPLRRFFNPKTNEHRSGYDDAALLSISWKLKMSIDKSTVEFRLIMLLSDLKDTCVAGEGLSMVSAQLDELARFLQNESRARGLLSPLMARHIGDLSILFQCLNQLQMYHPWSRILYAERARREAESEKCPRNTLPYIPLDRQLRYELLRNLSHLCDPTHRQYDYPSTKRRSKETVDAMIRAEKAIDTIWDCFDSLTGVNNVNFDSSAVRRLQQIPRTIHRTPEWTDDELSTPVFKTPIICISEATTLQEQMKNVYFDHDDNATKDADHQLERKPKIKTRGLASEPMVEVKESSASSFTNPQPDEGQPIQARIPVSPRALKVFRKLFFDPRAGTGIGEVAWNDFVYAMTGPGLFSAEQLYGSVWQFVRDSNSESSLGRSRIQFHEPHPNNKMSIVAARAVGRRLQRRFGWDISTFVLSE
ncbi:unnamed protein product [Clonostachys rosea]|uniref:Uncharacterized protein n=1 Tax=Bionectria ochroleuca TaxID=29856 RepID=A0ABY6U6K7_BIOOC|nr:unnamed protein product [Clonostachys rosea]